MLPRREHGEGTVRLTAAPPTLFVSRATPETVRRAARQPGGVTCRTSTFEKAIASVSRALHPARPAIDSRTRDHEARLFRAGRARARGGQARGGVVRACRPASPRSFFFDAHSADRVRSGTSRRCPPARPHPTPRLTSVPPVPTPQRRRGHVGRARAELQAPARRRRASPDVISGRSPPKRF